MRRQRLKITSGKIESYSCWEVGGTPKVSGPSGDGTCEVALAFIGMESGMSIAVTSIDI